MSSIKWFETKWRARLTEYLANQLVKCIRVDLTDDAAPYMDIGLLGARQLCRLLRGTAYGIREGRVMLDRRDRNPSTGAEFPNRSIVNPRVATCTLPALSSAEARDQYRDLLRLFGAAGDTLWIVELGDSVAERNRRAVWGAVNAPGEEASASRDRLPPASRAVRMVEGMRGEASRKAKSVSLLADLHAPWGYDEPEILRYSNHQFAPNRRCRRAVLDGVAAMPNVKGIMLCFDDFIKATDDFRTKNQPLKNCRQERLWAKA